MQDAVAPACGLVRRAFVASLSLLALFNEGGGAVVAVIWPNAQELGATGAFLIYAQAGQKLSRMVITEAKAAIQSYSAPERLKAKWMPSAQEPSLPKILRRTRASKSMQRD